MIYSLTNSFAAGTTSGITIVNTEGASTLTIRSLSFNTVTNTQDQYRCSIQYTGVGTIQSNFADVYVSGQFIRVFEKLGLSFNFTIYSWVAMWKVSSLEQLHKERLLI